MAHKIRQALLGNLWLKFLSLVIGAAIWMMVSNADNPTRTQLFTNIPINIINQDQIADIGKVVEPEGSSVVTLRVTEKRSVLERLSKSGTAFYVEADLNNITALNTVPLTVTCSNPSVTWDEIDISPSSLKVTLEDKVEQTYVASVSVDGSASSGYEVGSTSILEGKNIVIAGPRSLMNIINQVVAPINVAGMEEDSVLSGILKVYDKNGAAFTESQLSSLEFKDELGNVIADHTVSVSVDLWKIKTDVPIVVTTEGSPAWGYNVTRITTIPETISVAGTDEALELLGAEFNVAEPVIVSGAKETVSEEIDLSTILSGMEGIKLITDADPTVQVSVVIEANGDVTLPVPLSNIRFDNRPDKMNLVVTPADEVSVKVHPLSADAAALTAADLALSADLSACAEEGSYEIPIAVSLPEGYELAENVSITVVSTRQEAQTE